MARTDKSSQRSNTRGSILIEVAMGATFLSIAVLAYVMQISLEIHVVQKDRETTIALNAAREKLEEIRDYGTFSQIFAAYNTTTADDPADAPGAGFAVVGLIPQTGDADGLCGRVRMPTDANNPAALREDIDDPNLGTPTDLNGNGTTNDNFDVSGSYILIPIAVVIEWRSSTGSNRSFELRTMVVQQ